MHNAVVVAQKYEQFVMHYGDDPFISRTLSKMVSTRLTMLQKELRRVQSALARFEQIHGKTSDVFIKEFNSGVAGDDVDFIEWSAMVQMSERLRAERTALQGN
jgi:hypothetical protein